MQPFENKPGSGALFRPRQKSDNPKAPTLRGDALLQLEDSTLVEIEISAWSKESDKAGRWLSLSVKPKAARQQFNRDRFNQFVN